MSNLISTDRVGVLPVLSTSNISSSTVGNTITLNGITTVNGITTLNGITTVDDAAAFNGITQVNNTTEPINKLISEIGELKTAIEVIKTKMTTVPVDDLLSFSDPQPVSANNLDLSYSSRSKVLQPKQPTQMMQAMPLPIAAMPMAALTILPDNASEVNISTTNNNDSFCKSIIGVALVGLLGASVLSLSIIDDVLAEYFVIGFYAINKFYIMFVTNNMPRYTKCVFMLMAATLLFESAFLITSLFRLLDKPSHLYSAIAALIDVGASWTLSRL